MWACLKKQCNCNAIFGDWDCFVFFISTLELIVKKANAFSTKEPNKTTERLFGTLLENFFLCEDGSVLGSPPNMGFTGEFCVCVGQNVSKWHNFLRILNILTFHKHFADMLMTCTTKVFNSKIAWVTPPSATLILISGESTLLLQPLSKPGPILFYLHSFTVNNCPPHFPSCIHHWYLM